LKISSKIPKFKPKKGNANTYLSLWKKLSLNDARMTKIALEEEKIVLGDVLGSLESEWLCFLLVNST
jgi:hypothetical protein